jgi:hypothetical protein
LNYTIKTKSYSLPFAFRQRRKSKTRFWALALSFIAEAIYLNLSSGPSAKADGKGYFEKSG